MVPPILLPLGFPPSNSSSFLPGITWSHPRPSPALWLEAGPTLNGANGRVLNPFGKQISKDRSCLTSGGVKLVVAVAETLFLW